MAYTTRDFKSKKALREALAAGSIVRIYNPGIGNAPDDGPVQLEGPHYPAPHTWYAQGIMKDGCLVSVK